MNAQLTESPRAASRRYWHNRLLNIQKNQAPLPRMQGTVESEFSVEIPLDCQEFLASAASGHPFLRFTLLAGALSFAMYRLHYGAQFCFASPSIQREGAKNNLFIHHVGVDPSTTVRQFLESTRAALLEDQHHGAYPFELQLAAFDLNLTNHGLFDILLWDSQVHVLPDEHSTPLQLSLQENAVHIALTADSFPEATIRDWIDCWWIALRAFRDQLDSVLGDVDLLQEEERQQILSSFNQTDTRLKVLTATALIENSIHSNPQNFAVQDPLTNTSITYGQLNERAQLLAGGLSGKGVCSGSRVAILLHPSFELPAAILAVWRLGAAYIPLDPDSPSLRLDRILEDAQPTAVVTSTELRSLVPAAISNVLEVDQPIKAAPLKIDFQASPESLAYLIYTSGTTGQPKGVMVTQGNLANYLSYAIHAYGLNSHSGGVPLLSSIAFDLSVTPLLGSLAAGRTLVLLPRTTTVETLSAALEQGAEFSVIKVTPSHLKALNETIHWEKVTHSPGCLIVGGEALHYTEIAPWLNAFPSLQIINEYGPTETTVGSSVFEAGGCIPNATVPIGLPISNTQIYLLDHDQLPVPDGVIGELYIGGKGVTLGYFGTPSLTAYSFVPDPFGVVEGARLYRTGDRAYRNGAGNIEFVGRSNRQVKIRGFRVELNEIEAALLELPELRETAVVLTNEQSRSPRLTAYIVPHQTAPPLSVLRRHLRKVLPEYMIPAKFVPIDSLPLATSGKVDYGKLPNAESSLVTKTASGVEPSETERRLIEVWQSVLDVKSVGINDNFFDLGGDSILGIRLSARLRDAGLILQPSQIFEHGTISVLARLVTPVESTEIPELNLEAPVPLTPIQHWFFEINPSGAGVFCQTRLLELVSDPEIKVEKLQHLFSQLVQRHDALRLQFEKTEDGWIQKVGQSVKASWIEIVDLQDLSEAESASVYAIQQDACTRRISISNGPIMQATLFLLRNGKKHLFWAIHHLAVDHVSWLVLLNEAEALLNDPSRKLAPAPSFARRAHEISAHAHKGSFAEDIPYWLAQQSASELVPNHTKERDSHRLLTELSSVDTEKLLNEANQAYNTHPQELVLAALGKVWLKRYPEPTIMLEVSGRHGGNLDQMQTVGWFTALYPVRFKINDSMPSGEILREVKDTLRRVPQDGTSYGILRYLTKDIQASNPPQLIFNYLGKVRHETGDGNCFRAIPGTQGYRRDDQIIQPYLVEINAIIANGQLLTEFVWNSAQYSCEQMNQLTSEYLNALRELIEIGADQSGPGVTPSDFKHVNLDVDSLAAIFEEAGKE